jgi:hypothetical protein
VTSEGKKMAKHPRGSLGTSARIVDPRSSKTARQRNKVSLTRQQRRSGDCKIVYDRDQNVGAVPTNLKERE